VRSGPRMAVLSIHDVAPATLANSMRLRELVRAMFLGLANGTTDGRLLPSSSAAAEIGDFQANQARLRDILAAGISLES
jgi:hypothetical protein